MTSAQIIIDGEYRRAASGRVMDVNNPAFPDDIVGQIALADQRDVSAAIRAAHDAFPAWSALSYAERAEFLRTAAANLVADESHLDDRIRLFTREHGKVLAEAAIEFKRFSDRFEWSAEQADRLASDEELPGPPRDTIITRQARGVNTLIVPWNWPLAILGNKLPQALMTGNTVVVKLAEQSPLAPMQTLKLVADVLPAGVINVIASPVSEIGDSLVSDPLVRKVNFTGSIPAGKHIMKIAADTVKPVTLELGGNDAALVLDDADLDDESVRRIVTSTFMTAGQICMAVKRIYVHRSRYAEFVDKFTRVADEYVVGDGLEDGVTMGPVNNASQLGIVRELIRDSRDNGCRVTEVGKIQDAENYRDGYFQRPAIVTDCESGARIVQEEQFGPVVPILPFESDEDALNHANDTEFGLCSSVWTSDRERALGMARRIEAGYTYINGHGPMAQDHRAPFGGFKQSGIGRNLGYEGMLDFLEPHSIAAPPGWIL